MATWPDMQNKGGEFIVNTPAPKRGLSPTPTALGCDAEHAVVLENCMYDNGGNLILGRPRLVTDLWFSSDNNYDAGGAICSIIGGSDGKLYVGTYNGEVFRSTTPGTLQKLVDYGSCTPRLYTFNDQVVVANQKQLSSIDVNSDTVYLRGAHYNLCSEAPDNYKQLTTSGIVSAANDFTTGSTFHRDVERILVYIQNEGGSTDEITISLLDKTSPRVMAQETYSLAGVPTDAWTLIHVELTEVIELLPNNDYQILVEYNYAPHILIGFVTNDSVVTQSTWKIGPTWSTDSANAFSMSLNGIYEPKPTAAVKYKSRMYLFGDDDNNDRVYYSNVNDLDDYFTTEGGGYFSFYDSTDSEVISGVVFKEHLTLTGLVDGKYTTIVYKGDPPALETGTIYTDVGADTVEGFIAIPNNLLMSLNNTIIGGTTVSETGDIGWEDITKGITNSMISPYLTSNALYYVPYYNQVWCLPSSFLSDGVEGLFVFSLTTHGWSFLTFPISITAIYVNSGNIILGTDDGKIYYCVLAGYIITGIIQFGPDAIDDEVLDVEAGCMLKPIAGNPFQDKLLRRVLIDIGLTYNSGWSLLFDDNELTLAELEIYTDLDLTTPKETVLLKIPFSRVCLCGGTDSSVLLDTGSIDVPGKVFQYKIKSVNKGIIINNIVSDIVTYGEK